VRALELRRLRLHPGRSPAIGSGVAMRRAGSTRARRRRFLDQVGVCRLPP
jgi:hypothetical protein